jgi:hypothetical protein
MPLATVDLIAQSMLTALRAMCAIYLSPDIVAIVLTETTHGV